MNFLFKKIEMALRLCLLIACLFVILPGCQLSQASPTPGLPAKSMKGYELYSWNEGGEWFYTLLVGTNRLKTQEEVTSLAARLDNLDALKFELDHLDMGEEVFWVVDRVPGMALPPGDLVDEVSAFCQKRGVKLTIID